MEYSGLNQAQAKAVKSNHPRILCLAGAGTGKTRVLTHRIARLYEDGVKPEYMLALTFTRAAGAEMKERIIKLIGDDGRDIFCNTFHAWAVRLIRKYAYSLGYTPAFSIYDSEDKAAIIDQIINELQYNVETKKVLEAMDKNTLYRVPFPEGDIERIVNEYRFRCKKNNAIDLDGLIAAVGHLLKDEAIQDDVRERWPYIFVDEMQDTDHRQMEILNAINPHNLFVVGDDFQAIYGFRGADVSIIMNLAENPEYEVVKLEENYRSTATIVNAANRLIKHNNQTEKVLRSDRIGPEIFLIEERDEEVERIMVAAYIDDLHEPQTILVQTLGKETEEKVVWEGIPYKDIAVLGRTNKQIQEMAEVLTKNGIPCVIRTKSADAMESQEAKKLFSWMEAILNPKNDTAIESVLNWPETTVQPREKQSAEMFQLENDCSLKTALEATETARDFLDTFQSIQDVIWENYDEDDEVSAVDLWDFVSTNTHIKEWYHEQGLHNRAQKIAEIDKTLRDWQAHQVEIGEAYSAAAWLEYYRMRMLETDKQEENHEDAVQLMTAHGSKGLEFEAVFIIGCNNKTFPLGRGDIEGERRLFYVAMTRAKKYLYLTRSLTKIVWGDKQQETEESIFLQELGAR